MHDHRTRALARALKLSIINNTKTATVPQASPPDPATPRSGDSSSLEVKPTTVPTMTATTPTRAQEHKRVKITDKATCSLGELTCNVSIITDSQTAVKQTLWASLKADLTRGICNRAVSSDHYNPMIMGFRTTSSTSCAVTCGRSQNCQQESIRQNGGGRCSGKQVCS